MEDNNKEVKRKQVTKRKDKKDMTRPEKIKAFLRSKLFGIILSGVQLIFTVIFLSELLYLNILPLKYFLPLTLILLLIVAYTFLTAQSRKFRTFGKILSVLFVVLYSMGIYYVGAANGMFDRISGANSKTDIINIYVLKDNSAENIQDAKDYTFGILSSVDRENTDKTIDDIEENVGQEIKVEEFESWPELIASLYDGSVGAIILNSGYISSIVETEGYETFESDTKVLMKKEIVTIIDVDTNKDVTDNTFAIYISGIDVAGNISRTSRSDVNIIAVVNPDTKQVLLLNTPRDYYVNLAIKNNPMDKLTHAGIYGVDTSMETLEMLYDTDIDYYFRINFTGFKNVIDALGGIEVNSEYSFTTTHGGYYIKKGINNLNGNQALGFVRERYAFGTGDNQRGKNQMAVITAVINKMASSAILNDFTGLMDSLSGSFQTSMTSSQISSLVRMQLNEGGSWNVVNYAVTGSGKNDYCYSLGSSNYVMVPDTNTVENAKKLIQMVYDGKTLSLEGIE
ncbi:MAG: LCP family protein [Lachnospiraceae bacterium]